MKFSLEKHGNSRDLTNGRRSFPTRVPSGLVLQNGIVQKHDVNVSPCEFLYILTYMLIPNI